ncbi:MAG: hypothetical protein V3V33_00560 [Candidatus Lokiarchaeia archaeon]
MTAKRVKEIKNEQLTLENISIGDIIPDLHDEEITIDNDLIEQMRRFEKDTKKSAIWRNKITGSFLFYKWTEEHPEEKNKSKIEESLDEEIEEEVQNKENELLDAMEDYKMEYNVKKVNTNSQKFKQFFYKWKHSE